jgi:branched-chain amino acid transport system ATP-binding protein/branched-chain amino acid transport system permease protein
MTAIEKEFPPKSKAIRWMIVLALLAVITLPLITKNEFYLDLIVMIFFWATLAGAWNILGGFAGQISLGHTAYFGIGAYTSTLLYLNFSLSPWIGMLAGVGLSILVAIVVGYPCFRLSSHFFALATIAFAEVLRMLSSYWRGLTKGGLGLLVPFKPGFEYFMFNNKLAYAYIALTFMLLMIFVTWAIKRSRFGFHLISLREDQDGAESLGVNTHRCKTVALIISVVFTSIMGTFYAQYFQFIDPEICFSISLSIQLALLSIIGGLGTLLGPVMGAFLLTPIDVLLRGWLGGVFAGLNLIVYGAILIVAVMYFPIGIGGWLKIRWERLLRDRMATPPIPLKTATASSLHPSIPPGDNRTAEPTLLKVRSFGKHFGGLHAVRNLSFHMNRGEIVGLIGPNGAGKTTIFNLISGFYSADSGEMEFKRERITGLAPPHKVCRKGIARTFQIVKPFNNMTVLENIMVGVFCRIKDPWESRKEALRIIDFVGLGKHQFSQASSLTIADRKRLELARALATKPELLLLDEVVAGLTPKETTELMSVIKSISAQGVTVLMIEHVMKAVMTLSNRIIVIHHGEKIAEGTPAEVGENKAVIDAYLGKGFRRGK